MNELNDGHYVELLDRLYVLTSNLETYILNHPLTENNPKIKWKIEKAINELAQAYQLVGKLNTQ